eukprot:gene6739-7833_t
MEETKSVHIERGITASYPVNCLPLFFRGLVIKGFGRGSKQLGVPTVGLHQEKVFKMAMSIGWNPFYKNTEKTIEIHIMQRFEEDFYDQELSAIATGFIRPMCDFDSLEDLIKAINDDIEYANSNLDTGIAQN